MLDAYAVRKAIPRVVIAVIGINLSIYLCVAIVDIVNVVAGGMAGLIVSPFALTGMTDFEVNTDPANAIVAGVGVAVGGGPMVAAATAAFTAVATGGISVVLSALGALLWMLMPIILLALAILVVVVIRQALLFFLIIVSPIAIVCYILPGTEKYFSKWWDLFFKTLLVYPIIALIFALSDVFGSIIMSTNGGGLTGVAKIITAIIVIYAPLFLIPFAFKFAGGAMATLTKAATGVSDRMAQSGFVKQRREYYGQKHQDNMVRGRAEAYRNAQNSYSKSSGLRKFYHGRRASGLSGYRTDILDREAEVNERAAKATAATSGSGDDSYIRAYTVNKELADRERAAGRGEGNLWRTTDDGGIEYRSAGGSWQSEANVKEARNKYGRRNTAQLQQSMAYEMKKSLDQEDKDRVIESFGGMAQEWGMSENQTNGAWIGAGFANQDSDLQLKHGRWTRNDDGSYSMKANGGKVIKEIDEKKGAYASGQYSADTWTSMGREVEEAHEVLTGVRAGNRDEAIESIQRASRVASSLGGSYRNPETGEIIDSIGQGAPARVAEEMRAFAKIASARGAEHGFVYDPSNPEYGTPMVRTDDPTGTPTPRTDSPYQSNRDRNRPSSS